MATALSKRNYIDTIAIALSKWRYVDTSFVVKDVFKEGDNIMINEMMADSDTAGHGIGICPEGC